MPITARIDHTRDMTVFIAGGEITVNEVSEVIKSVQTKNVLIDFRNAVLGSFRPDDIDQLSKLALQNPEIRLGGKTAIVAPNDIAFEVARIFKNLTVDAPRKLKVFRMMVKATEWLGIEDMNNGIY
jgi:hypothetical protein